MNTTDDITDLADSDKNELSLLETLITYVRHWRYFVLSVVICMALSYLYIKLETPLYKAETNILKRDNKPEMGGQNEMLKDMGLFSSEKIIDNEIQILKSNTLIEKVIVALKLQTSYISTEGINKRELYGGSCPFQVQLVKPSLNAYHVILSIHLINGHEALVNGKKVIWDAPFETDAGLVQILPNPTGFKYFNRQLNVKFVAVDDLLQKYKD